MRYDADFTYSGYSYGQPADLDMYTQLRLLQKKVGIDGAGVIVLQFV
ncbi:MAG: hypothetical protein JXD22_02475 [Sedimentisphaerales bacterium]|nr:hypothetical protein [Sedimentisphaerales bacterium]